MLILIVRLILAAFLLFLNIFSLVLVKCQKNDREKKILQSLAEGSSGKIDFKEPQKPDKQVQEAAKETLEKEEKEKEKGLLDTEGEFPKDRRQKKDEKQELVEKYYKKPVSDVKLLLCALLGGALGIYLGLFIFRYRLRDITMMVLVPTILIINVFFYLQVFTVWLVPAMLTPAVRHQFP